MSEHEENSDDPRLKLAALLRDIDPALGVPGPTPVESLGLAELLALLQTTGQLKAISEAFTELVAERPESRLKAIMISEGLMYLCKVASVMQGSGSSRKAAARAVAAADQARARLITLLEKHGKASEGPPAEEAGGAE